MSSCGPSKAFDEIGNTIIAFSKQVITTYSAIYTNIGLILQVNNKKIDITDIWNRTRGLKYSSPIRSQYFILYTYTYGLNKTSIS